MHFRKFYLLLPAEVKVEKKKDRGEKSVRVYKTILSSFFRNNSNSLSQFINTFKKNNLRKNI